MYVCVSLNAITTEQMLNIGMEINLRFVNTGYFLSLKNQSNSFKTFERNFYMNIIHLKRAFDTCVELRTTSASKNLEKKIQNVTAFFSNNNI